MPVDNPTPLATAATFNEGALADLARSYSPTALNDILIQATRACETECGRRLAPFTLTETHRAEGIDPDEYSDSSNLPLDLIGSLGRSYAYSLGVNSLVRHVWLNEYAPLYQEMWTYSGITVNLVRSYGGNQAVATTQTLSGPEPDTGHLWFNLGLFMPVGSLMKVTYSGGYTTVPADLVRACIYMAGAIIVRELDPLAQTGHGHSPEALEAVAISWLSPYVRS